MDTLYLLPNWPAPQNVRAYSTTRIGGYSQGPYANFNIANHVADDTNHVEQNRQNLSRDLHLPNSPFWLEQIHSNKAVLAGSDETQADASYTQAANTVCIVQTADCLPILICNRQGTEVAAIHAGWRGLASGILENTIDCLTSPAEELLIWFGPAIGRDHFEVGEEVRAQFLNKNEQFKCGFRPHPPQKWLADIYALAWQICRQYNIHEIYGAEFCTYSDKEKFYSYRRDQTTGRMASLIWLEPDTPYC